MKVACYLRVSTLEQSLEGYSIAAQKNRLEAYCVSQGWEVVHWYVDEGKSAKDIDRPELKRLLKGVEKKAFDIVLVYRLDRLTRSVLDLYSLLQRFEDKDVKFKSATEVYDTTTATGRLFLTLIASLAQWERENLAERVSFGMEEKAKQGEWTVASPPYGYIKEDEKLKIVESEAIIIRRIFKMYLENKMGTRKIAYILNGEGLKTRHNKPFNDRRINYIIRNPLYIGTMRYNYRVNKDRYFEVENAAPPIIDKETFEEANRIIDKRANMHPRSATSKHIFSGGLLKCARCGYPMYGKTSVMSRNGKKYESRQYYCSNRQKNLACDMPVIAQTYLESQFIKLLESFNDDEIREQVLGEGNEEKDHTNEIESLRSEISKIEKRKSKWQYAWVNEMISDSDFANRMKEEEQKEKTLLSELEVLEKNNLSTDISIPHSFEDITNGWKYLDEIEKKNFVMMMFKSITVEKTDIQRSPESVAITDFEFN
jgi:site-specific DNA recombinase